MAIIDAWIQYPNKSKLGPKKRKNPSDHSKNAKIATIVVIYSLR